MMSFASCTPALVRQQQPLYSLIYRTTIDVAPATGVIVKRRVETQKRRKKGEIKRLGAGGAESRAKRDRGA